MLTGDAGAPPAPRAARALLGAVLAELGPEMLERRRRELAASQAAALDPLPVALEGEVFAGLAACLVQRARLLEALLADAYGPRRGLAEAGLLPGTLYADTAWLPAAAIEPPCRFLHRIGFDLQLDADGVWRVLADHTDTGTGLGHTLRHRASLARALPELFEAQAASPLPPLIERWREALVLALPPGAEGAVALLTGGATDADWAEHLALAEALGCILVQERDLTVRGGALQLKTLRALRPVALLLRLVSADALDPLETAAPSAGIPGLLAARRGGALAILNAPGSRLAQSAALRGAFPALCPALLGEPLWLEATAPLPGAWRLRLHALALGEAWHILPGGTAWQDGTGALHDAWVLAEPEPPGAPAARPPPAIALGSAAGDLPSRVAEDAFWLGRRIERLESAGRLIGALARRLTLAPLPHELRELELLIACLREAGLAGEESTARAGPALAASLLRLDLAAWDGELALACREIGRLTEALRDRLTDDLAGFLQDGVRMIEARRRRRAPPTLPEHHTTLRWLEALARRLTDLSAGTAGRVAENMVAGGTRLFLDAGRRLDRGRGTALCLARLLDRPPGLVEAGLCLALELADSTLAHRQRAADPAHPAIALDLLLTSTANPRAIGFQLAELGRLMAALGDASEPGLVSALSRRQETLDGAVRAVASADDPAVAAAGLPPVLREIAVGLGEVGEAISRRYFSFVALRREMG